MIDIEIDSCSKHIIRKDRNKAGGGGGGGGPSDLLQIIFQLSVKMNSKITLMNPSG